MQECTLTGTLVHALLVISFIPKEHKNLWIYSSCSIIWFCIFNIHSDIDLVVFGELGDCPYFRLGNELEKSGITEPGSIKVLDKASVSKLVLKKGSNGLLHIKCTLLVSPRVKYYHLFQFKTHGFMNFRMYKIKIQNIWAWNYC